MVRLHLLVAYRSPCFLFFFFHLKNEFRVYTKLSVRSLSRTSHLFPEYRILYDSRLHHCWFAHIRVRYLLFETDLRSLSDKRECQPQTGLKPQGVEKSPTVKGIKQSCSTAYSFPLPLSLIIFDNFLTTSEHINVSLAFTTELHNFSPISLTYHFNYLPEAESEISACRSYTDERDFFAGLHLLQKCWARYSIR